jgi:protein PhnA
MNAAGGWSLSRTSKVKGSSTTLKVGTKIKNICVRGGDHAVEAASYMLKAEFLRKA